MSFRRILLDIFTRSVGAERLLHSLERVFFNREYQLRGVRFRVKLHNATEKWRWDQLISGKKEPETGKWIEDTLSDAGGSFDIGANIGNYTVYAAKSHPRLRIFAFEPEPCSFVQFSK